MGDSGENAAAASNDDEPTSEDVDYNDYDVRWMMTEIEKEREMADMLDQSVGELKGTVFDLHRQLESIDNEGNEWKAKYETQCEMNQSIQRKINELHENMRHSRATKTRDIKTTNVTAKDLNEHTEAGLNMLVRKLEKEKFGLEGQLRDIEWRLDQESKAYYKAAESKKKYMTELNQASKLLNSYERMQKADSALSPSRKQQPRKPFKRNDPVKLPNIQQNGRPTVSKKRPAN